MYGGHKNQRNISAKANNICEVCDQLHEVIINGQLEAANSGYLYGPQLTPRCKEHPRYKGNMFKPKNDCEGCWELFELSTAPDFAI